MAKKSSKKTPATETVAPTRELLVALYFAGGQPELAMLTGPTDWVVRDVAGSPVEVQVPRYTLEQYLSAVGSPQYDTIRADIERTFKESLDGVLLGQLYLAQREMTSRGFDKDAAKHYRETLKLTQPIIERLQAAATEARVLDGLTIYIKGAETPGEKSGNGNGNGNGHGNGKGGD